MKQVARVVMAAFVFLTAGAGVFAHDDAWPVVGEHNLYTPMSGVFRSTMGTLSSDIDRFMAPSGFQDIEEFDRAFGFLGFDELGFNLGFSTRLAPKVYVAAGYGGGLINDILNRLTNSETLDLTAWTREESGGADASVTEHRIQDSFGETVGNAKTSNDFSFLVGLGGVGIKLGFSQYLEGSQTSTSVNYSDYLFTAGDTLFESNVEVSLAVGGLFHNALELRGALDSRSYSAAKEESVVMKSGGGGVRPRQFIYT